MNSIKDIKYAFYINLSSRPDRKMHVETQMEQMGISATRFNAIRTKNGAIGCSLSHLQCLTNAKNSGWPHVLIAEDDVQFLDPELLKKQLSTFFCSNREWDVLLLGGNNAPPYEAVDDTCVKVGSCQTTTCYLVKCHYYDTLIDNYRKGIENLVKNPEQHSFYAIDKFWFHLQKKDNWFLIIPLTVTQKEDYSDIEKRYTNYTKSMLDLDKKNYIITNTNSFQREKYVPKLSFL